jgi:hypothetical protein
MDNRPPLPIIPPEIEGDPILGVIIHILRKAREEDEAEELERHIEAARSIA